jgi:AcrR family transcriptional regulator
MAPPVKAAAANGRKNTAMKDGLPELLEISSRLMARQGFHGTSMRDLAEASGRSIAGLYHYFRNKEELLYLINFRGFSTVKKTLTTMLEALTAPEERLYALILNHVSYFALHRNEMRVMLWGTQSLSAEAAKTITELKGAYGKVAQAVVQDAIVHLTGAPLSEIELEKQTYLLFGMMNWVYGWYEPKRHGAVGELADDVYATFLTGAAGDRQTLPGRVAVQKLFRDYRSLRLWDDEGGGK